MFNPWYETMMLTTESYNAIGLRMIKMSLMFRQTIAASWGGGSALMNGGNVFGNVDRYGEHVSGNVGRLALKAEAHDGPITPSEDVVRIRAYELWEATGRTHGHDEADWFQAVAA